MVSSEILDGQAPPQELTGPVPRRVSASQNTVGGMMGLALLFLIFAGLMAWGSRDFYHQLQIRAALRQSHETVMGQVSRVLHGRHSDTVEYQFSVAGLPYAGSSRLPTGRNPRRSDPIPIRYNPANPNMNHPDAWEWSPYSYLFEFLLITFWPCLGAAVVVDLFRSRELVRYGQPAVGSVVNCVPNKKLYRIEYRFRTNSGEELTGKSNCKEAIETGSRIWVLYLPRNPQRNCLYPNFSFDVC